MSLFLFPEVKSFLLKAPFVLKKFVSKVVCLVDLLLQVLPAFIDGGCFSICSFSISVLTLSSTNLESKLGLHSCFSDFSSALSPWGKSDTEQSAVRFMSCCRERVRLGIVGDSGCVYDKSTGNCESDLGKFASCDLTLVKISIVSSFGYCFGLSRIPTLTSSSPSLPSPSSTLS